MTPRCRTCRRLPPQSRNTSASTSAKGLTQLRIAETEKYAHVTFFFNGGVEKPYAGEDRCCPLPEGRDLRPPARDERLRGRGKVRRRIESGKYDVIILNFANCDMVGHTGVFDAAVKAVETVDSASARSWTRPKDGRHRHDHRRPRQRRADDEATDGDPFTAHTTNPVPFIALRCGRRKLRQGRLADIAPTMHSAGAGTARQRQTDWKARPAACRKEVRLLAASLVTAVAGAAGYFVSNAVLSRLYDFKSYNFIVWDRDENWFTLDRILMDFFHEFGYQNGSGVFHFGGIAAGIGLLLGCWMFFCIVRLLLRLEKLETNDKLLVLLLVAMLAVCGMSYAYFHEYYLYFWLMNMPVAIAVMAVEIKTEDFHLPGARQLLGVVLAGCFTVCAVNTVRQEQEHPYLAHKGLNAAADWLVDNGYTEGYSTFWNGNAMTELTSGKLDVWTLQSLDHDYVPNWLQPKEPPDHRPGAPVPAHRHRD